MQILEETIRQYLDLSKFEAESEQQEKESTEISELRKKVLLSTSIISE